MLSQSMSELMSSLKQLLSNGAYSDLEIRCGNDKHQVHKAIVCPRSERLSDLCAKLVEDEDIISLETEDPQAVSLMLTYLYTLDYPQIPSNPKETPITLNGTVHAEDPKHNVNVQQHQPPIPIQSKDYSREDEQFVESAPASDESVKKRNKKKKRGSQSTAANAPLETTAVESQQQQQQSTTTTAPSNLVIHAKLYALGTKYGIQGLKTLSADKFEKEVEHSWESEDFLGAAQEAYTSAGDDRTIRDAVLNAMKEHPQLLDRKQVQDVIKRLELSFDLLMHMHNHSQTPTSTTPVSTPVTSGGKTASVASNSLRTVPLVLGKSGVPLSANGITA